jgi:hypothetical protein
MHGSGRVLRGIAASPDGKTLAVQTGGAGVLFFDTRSYEQVGNPLPRAEAGEEGSIAYSPDGRSLALGGDHSVRLVDARTHARVAKTDVFGDAMRLAFTRDGSRVGVLRADPGETEAVLTGRAAATHGAIGGGIEPES